MANVDNYLIKINPKSRPLPVNLSRHLPIKTPALKILCRFQFYANQKSSCMKKIYLGIAMLMVMSVNLFSQSTISLTGAPYGENFSTLANSGTSSTMPLGWSFIETGTNLNTTYNSGTGSNNAGDTYSFGAAASTERALGGLRSGSLIPSFGAAFINNTGSPISVLTISYIGEQWRLGATGRADRIDFQYSLDATAINNGTWTDVNALDFSSPTTTGVTGALDGNAAANRTNISNSITGLSIPNGATFYIRWIDIDATGADDGLSIDDFSLSTTASGGLTASIAAGANPAEPSTNSNFTVTLSSPAPAGGITVNYTLSGTATQGTDYQNTTGSVFIAEGVSTANIDIIIIDDAIVDLAETIIATINTGTGYSPGTPTSATLIITDNEVPPATGIGAIQGTGSTATPGTYTIEAVVTAVYSAWSPAGFYVQEEDADADADPNTSNAIFVASTAAVAVGDRVSITGTVQENGLTPSFNQAVIIPNSVTVVNSGNPLPTLTEVSLPLSSTADLERFEGMLVRFSFPLTVTDIGDLGRFGELRLSSGGLVYQATQFIDPNDDPASGNTISGTSNVAAINAYNTAIALRSFILDDGRNGIPATLPFVDGNNTIRIGSTINNLTAIMAFGFSAYRAFPLPGGHPYATPAFSHATRPTVPSVGVTANVKIGSFNVLNYFNGDGAGAGFPTARGANSLIEFNRQRDKIISAISQMNADVVGLIELENDGTGTSSAIQDLVNGLNTLMGPGTYAFINDGASSQTFNTDEIRCGIIYKPSVVTPVGTVMTSNNAVFDRPPLAHAFQLANGRIFNYIVNHFKSKGCGGATGADTDQGDGQSCYNDRRKQQALELVNFINTTVIPSSGSSFVISTGDYNAYFEEDPMDRFRANGFNVLGSSTDYSFNFQGQLGSLDHAIISSNLIPGLTGFAKWNINSTEPGYLDYNDGIQDAGESASDVNPWAALYGVNPYASSDHDAILMGFNITSTLPVKIKSFSVVKEKQYSRISWATETEINSKEFVIERSVDGQTFSPIGKIAARGNNSNYEWVDNSPLSGNNFYRIKMIDIDLRFEYSKTGKLFFGKGIYFSVSPNPAKSIVTVYVENVSKNSTLQLTDLNGRLVKQINLSAGPSQNISFSVADQAKGVYVLKLIGSGEVRTSKLVVE